MTKYRWARPWWAESKAIQPASCPISAKARLRKSFLLDHPAGATREQAILLLEEIDAGLDNSVDAEDLRSQIRNLRREFELEEEPIESIGDFPRSVTRCNPWSTRKSTQPKTRSCRGHWPRPRQCGAQRTSYARPVDVPRTQLVPRP
ncbi:hypothetical protein ACRAWF_02995 [Streptomyces sp. L7]